MNALAALAAGGGVGIGVLLCIAGWRGHRLLPSLQRSGAVAPLSRSTMAWVVGAAPVGLIVFALTGWIVAALVCAGVVVWAPQARKARSQQGEVVAKTEAIASWAEMIRDNMAGSAGLEQALLASARVAPAAIRPQLRRFASRLERVPLSEALIALGRDLDHPSADLVVVSLVNATRMEARELGPLLGRLAEAIRGDVRMRLRVEVGRARIRTSARIVVATTVGTMAFLFLFSRRLLEAYDSLVGQLWLLLVAAVFAGGAWLLRVYGRVEMPERFSARAGRAGGAS